MNLKNIKLKTWIEISEKAFVDNVKIFRKLLAQKTKLWFVVKSNAYGHGLLTMTKLGEKYNLDGFCVDSVIEGEKLRGTGIKKSILVLGPTLPNLYNSAAKNEITLSISNFEFLKTLAQSKNKPDFHIKVDTGMHRQGFYLKDLLKAAKFIKQNNLAGHLKGVFTHFASAKDINYPTYTDLQFQKFKKAIEIFRSAKLTESDFISHCSATAGVLINKNYQLDAVRIGIGLYGLWPSKELEIQLRDKYKLQPILSWYSLISEIKSAKKGGYVGYDLTERLVKNTKIAVVPIGYWHGYDRRLSSLGEVLLNGKRTKVLGRISMDLIVVDTNGIRCKVGDKVLLIGKSGAQEIPVTEIAQKIDSSHYEVLTRINPLIKRVIVY